MFMKRLQQFFILAACLLVIAVAAVQRDGRLWGIPLSDAAKSAARNQADTLRVLDDGTVVISTAGLAKGVKGFGGPVPLEIYLKKGRVQQVKALPNSRLFPGSQCLVEPVERKAPRPGSGDKSRRRERCDLFIARHYR